VKRVVVVARDAVRTKNVREDMVAVQWRLISRCLEALK
jgi:hypothetical protein